MGAEVLGKTKTEACTLFPAVATMVTDCRAEGAPAVIRKLALVAPLLTIVVAGTVSAPPSAVRVTVRLLGAG